jgi:hypothetical protein
MTVVCKFWKQRIRRSEVSGAGQSVSKKLGKIFQHFFFSEFFILL